MASDTLRVDLSGNWMSFSEDFQKPQGNVRALHLKLESPNGSLQITNHQPFSLFLNNRLMASSVNKIFLPLDSVANKISFPLNVSVFSKHDLQDLSAQIASIVPDKNMKSQKYREDIIITASIFLLILVVILLNTNTVGTKEYFNIAKVFSTKYGDEESAMMRLNSANNVFLILLVAGLISLNFFGYFGIQTYREKSFDIMDHFFFLTLILAIIFSVLMLKLAIIVISSRLFRLSEFASSQYFNFLRMLLFAFTFTSIILITAFMLGIEINLLKVVLKNVIIGLIVLFVITTFLKLSARRDFTVFHLFSYLCASEIIPGIILLNVFFL
jgi:Domain of unknown function (DUF4271)